MNTFDPTVLSRSDPHAQQPVLTAGPPLGQANAAMVLLHGRGASAEDILALHHVMQLDQVTALAPQAYGHSWYPHSFLAETSQNQRYLDSALAKLDALVHQLINAGIPSERISLLGFSQGACLTSEYVARNPRRYGAVCILTGGIIGPLGTPRSYTGDLRQTPIFIGTSEPDPHVPIARVLETAEVLKGLGGDVELRRYRGMPHTINQEELEICREMILKVGRVDPASET